MTPPTEVPIERQRLDRFIPILGADTLREATGALAAVAELVRDRACWHVNSTARGGGVAEMLHTLLGYARDAGLDARWLAIEGDPDFFRVTKRLHHALHGMAGDGSPLGERERATYERTLAANVAALRAAVRPGDLVLLHDPQTAGLAPALMDSGALVAWRSHIGADVAGAETDLAWDFLRPYLDDVPVFVFSRAGYIPAWCPPDRARVIMPSIDPFSPKNAEMDATTVGAILARTGLLAATAGAGEPGVHLENGTVVNVTREVEVIRDGPPLDPDTPLVTQVSRWDPLKDPVGVMRGFADLVGGAIDAELLLAGPDVTSVADDPEAVATFAQVRSAWGDLPDTVRRRVHLAALPMDDLAENAAIVNAIQRHATVVVQKSLREGFGLTVTEAMWKARPVIASRIGGIVDQIEDGVDGLLLDDPTDPAAFAAALRRLLTDRAHAARLGTTARERVRREFLPVRHLLDYAATLVALLERDTVTDRAR